MLLEQKIHVRCVEEYKSSNTYSNLAVDVNKHFLENVGGDDVGDFFVSRPDVLQEDFLAFLGLADGFLFEVDVDGTSEGVGNNERRAGQVVGTNVRVNTTFEVSVTREDTSDNQITGLDGGSDLIGQRTGVTDASGATVANNGKAELFHIRQQARAFQVAGDDTRTGSKRGLDVRLNVETSLDGLLGQQSSTNHNVGVRCVSARSDGGNDDISVLEFVLLAFVFESDLLGELGFSNAEALEANLVGHALVEVGLHVLQRNVVVRTLGARQSRDDSAQVKLLNYR